MDQCFAGIQCRKWRLMRDYNPQKQGEMKKEKEVPKEYPIRRGNR